MNDRPGYIEPDTWRTIERARLTRIWGKLNVYTCERCRAQLVTTDLDEGTTPFTTRCRAPLCAALAVSAMYRISSSQVPVPTHGWYRPETIAELDEGAREHVERGGLLLRELTPDELAILAA